MPSDMPDIKITYFNIPGRAEMARLALKIGGIDFKDERIAFEDWPALRATTPYKAIPTLTVDGRVYAQSYAIARYCGRLTGLYPEDVERALLVDEVLATFEDVQHALRAGARDGDEAIAHRTAFFKREDEAPGAGGADRLFGGLERRLVALGAGPFVLGDEMSVADLGLYCGRRFYRSGMLAHFPVDALDRYDKLNEIADNVAKHPVVKAWEKAHE